MYINPVVVGVIGTIFFEIIAFIIYGAFASHKTK